MKQVTWGLIGCGDIARKRVAAALVSSKACTLMAVCRAQSKLVRDFAEEFGAAKWYEAWSDLLNDSEINAVYIATPVHLHAPQTIAAAEAGKHVLCEKPMALGAADCDRMIAACRANGVKLGIAYYRHFYPVIERAKEIIKQGEIGAPVVVQINAFESFDPKPDHPRYWLLKKEQSGGGPMFDFGCHRIEVMVNILGPISRMSGLTSNAVLAREVEDTAAALFQFQSGASGVLSVSHAVREAADTLHIFGTRGSLHIPVLNEGMMQVIRGNERRTEVHPPAANLHAPLVNDFVDALLNDREPAVNGDAGRVVAAIEDAVYDPSARHLDIFFEPASVTLE